ncbi:MAG: UV-endonuclease UvdE [Thermoleophilia bacterium]|nr:UV-endonuclease UvdE [Thermoleophilia bacterium]
MRLGFAVKLVSTPGFPSHDSRRWQSGPHLRTSIERLHALLGQLDRLDIRMYRIPDGFVPYGTHPDLPQFHHQLEECASELAEVGARVRELDVRLSNHPGQYTVLNSTRDDVRDKAIWDLEQHAALFDARGLDDAAVVVLHVGSATDGHAAGLDRFERALDQLGARARNRLVIEHDDRSYSCAQVLELSRRTGLRVVFDTLHHYCLNPERLSPGDALAAALATWPEDQVPKVHVSSPRLDAEWPAPAGTPPKPRDTRAHSDLIDPLWFERWLATDVTTAGRPFDVMLEAKAKDVAVLRLREQLQRSGHAWKRGQLQLA